MPELVVIVPSRGRPAAAAELAAACEATCTDDTLLLVCVDDNDPTLPDYDRALLPYQRALVHAVDRPAGHVRAINAGAAEALRWKDAPAVLAKLDDDHRPRTLAWDAVFLAALDNMGTGIVYGDDRLQGERLPTAPAMTIDIVRALGFMGPPTLGHLYVDNFWRDLGQAASCLRYLPGVVVEHMHPLAGKAPWDDGYRRVNSPESNLADGTAYGAYVRGQMAADVAKVQALMAAPAGAERT